jgi:hypothetical protein
MTAHRGGDGARTRRGWHLAGLVLLLAGCAGLGSTPEGLPPELAQRPVWRVGDRWVFARTSVAGVVRVVTYEVVDDTAEGYLMRISGVGPSMVRWWTKDLHVVRQTVGDRPLNAFEPPARYFAWPLALGAEWRQEFEYRDGRHDGRYVNLWRIADGLEPVAVLNGQFPAIRIDQLDAQGQPLQTYWYVPAVRIWAKFQSYRDGYVEELMEFSG